MTFLVVVKLPLFETSNNSAIGVGENQEVSPFNDGTMDWFWHMERVYVSSQGKFVGEREYYKRINGKNYPGIPFDLLMVMFTSWGKTTYSIQDSINNFY